VLRDGTVVAAAPAPEFDPRRLVSLMAGRELAEAPHARGGQALGADVILEVQGLGRDRAFQDVSFHIRRGEVLGLAGLVGAGRSEVAGAVYGLQPADRGEIRLQGRPVRICSPAQALGYGIAMVTEDRHASGIVPPLSLRHNLTLSSLDRCSAGPWVRAGQEHALASKQVRALAIRASGLDQPVHLLSGGNQQKALLARALLTQPSLLILDEPTRGIDVAAKAEIHRLIRCLAGQGLAVLVISSELPEILALSDRVLVMREGRVVAGVNARETSADEILHQAMPG
jgi:ABC-type sugar transport system ATPase subunit